MATAVTQIRFGSTSEVVAVAPSWHTSALVGFFVLLAAAGAALQQEQGGGAVEGSRPNLAALYVFLSAGECGLLYYVWKLGLRRTGTRLVELVGGSWTSPRAVLMDVLLAGAIWALWKGIGIGLTVWLGGGGQSAGSVSKLLPHGPVESSLWVLVSVCAGFAEEFVFRGYLQRQFTAYTGSLPLALLLQVAVFGIAHGYQGALNCLMVSMYAALFTLLALWRGSLRPGMLAHAWTDIASGLLH